MGTSSCGFSRKSTPRFSPHLPRTPKTCEGPSASWTYLVLKISRKIGMEIDQTLHHHPWGVCHQAPEHRPGCRPEGCLRQGAELREKGPACQSVERGSLPCGWTAGKGRDSWASPNSAGHLPGDRGLPSLSRVVSYLKVGMIDPHGVGRRQEAQDVPGVSSLHG